MVTVAEQLCYNNSNIWISGISWASVTNLSKGENVSMEVLIKICTALRCDIGDIMELIPEND